MRIYDAYAGTEKIKVNLQGNASFHFNPAPRDYAFVCVVMGMDPRTSAC